jgi:hypothetical protein
MGPDIGRTAKKLSQRRRRGFSAGATPCKMLDAVVLWAGVGMTSRVSF